METTQKKLKRLQESLAALGGVAVAFSGGVDSTFLLKVAHDTLGDRAIAVTAASRSFPERELKAAKAFCEAEGITQIVCKFDELAVEGFRQNPPDRCYLCKRALFGELLAAAGERGITAVAEGSNTDDEGDYRPGMRAVRELGVLSPLRQAGLSNAEIRELSRDLGLPTWDKPSYACLASRFVYGETISEEKLSMVDKAEQLLLDLGFRQVRVRIHGRMARIEVLPQDFGRLLEEDLRKSIYEQLRAFGFSYVTLDLLGYRTGSMNETLKQIE